VRASGAQQGQMRVRRQACGFALLQLCLGEGRVIVPSQRGIERVLRMPGLNPHLAACGVLRVAAGAAGRLHQQCEQAFRRAEVAAEERRVRIDRGQPA
jgi:hypothetical protein